MSEQPIHGRVIPEMVFGSPHQAFPTPVAHALIEVAEATEQYFEGAGGPAAKAVVSALTKLHEAWEASGG